MSLSASTIQRWMGDIREREAATWIAAMVGGAEQILNIGPSWGRDYYSLRAQGKMVVNLDIAPQPHLEDMVIADAGTAFPFPDHSFDSIIMAEVLEHLTQDWAALREVHRVLRPEGRLVVSVPFFNDEPLFHVRIHSPRSITRLLNAAGFTIEQTIYRSGCAVYMPRLVHAVRKGLRLFKMDSHWYRAIIDIDSAIGRQPWASHIADGVYVVARKSTAVDWGQINREAFRH